MFGEKRGNSCLCDQMRALDTAQPCPWTPGDSSGESQKPLWQGTAVGSPKSLSGWLQKDADISCGEKGKLLSDGTGDWVHAGLRTEFCGGNGAGKAAA